jgi:ABC-2 type transport system permease protein
VRLLGVAANTAALFLFVFAPFANVAVFMGRPGMLAIYPAIIALAALIACAAMLLTLALVRLLGARRTRTLAQVLAAVAGALLFLLSQAANFMPRAWWRRPVPCGCPAARRWASPGRCSA